VSDASNRKSKADNVKDGAILMKNLHDLKKPLMQAILGKTESV